MENMKNLRRKGLICRCGGTINVQKAFIEGFLINANVCEKCGDTGLPLDTAKELLRLREEARKIKTTRKILRIGNSIGVTLPQEAEGIGFKEGQKVEIELLGEGEIGIKRKV